MEYILLDIVKLVIWNFFLTPHTCGWSSGAILNPHGGLQHQQGQRLILDDISLRYIVRYSILFIWNFFLTPRPPHPTSKFVGLCPILWRTPTPAKLGTNFKAYLIKDSHLIFFPEHSGSREPERAKMAAKPPIFARVVENFTSTSY